MTTRFCPRCDNEVEDTGGYCLLGHRLALEPLNASLTDLREEIDQAFEDARLEVEAVVSGTEITQPMRVQTAPPPPPAPLAPQRPRGAAPPPPPPPRRAPEMPSRPVEQMAVPVQPSRSVVTSAVEPAQKTSERTVEPEPDFPSEAEIVARKYPVWEELEEASPLIGDPIGAFAPPPHMDWGPEKSKPKLLKRKPSRALHQRPSEA